MIENFLIRISYFTDEGRKVYSKLEQALGNATFEVKDDRKTAAGQAAASIFAVNNALAS